MKCKVCGKRFKLLAANKYIVVEAKTAFESLAKAPKLFECFDCPKCGCQNIVNAREETLDTKESEEECTE